MIRADFVGKYGKNRVFLCEYRNLALSAYIYLSLRQSHRKAMFNYINLTLMKNTKSLLTLTAVLAFTYGAGWLLFNAFQNLGLTTGPVGFPEAVQYSIEFALGIPVTLAQLAAMKYGKELYKSLN